MQVPPVELVDAIIGRMFIRSDDQIIGGALRTNGQFAEAQVGEVVDWLDQHLSWRPHTFVDVGANIGTHTIYALKLAGFENAVACEPDADNLLLLKANLAINDLGRRTFVVPAAVSSVSGTLELELSETNHGDHRIRPTERWSGPDIGEAPRISRTVSVVTLDTLPQAAVKDWSDCLLWLDTQGHEGHVLQGGQHRVLPAIRAVVMEFWPYGLARTDGAAAVFEYLATCHEIRNIGTTGWQDQPPVSLPQLREMYDCMLAATVNGHYPHTDLLCLPVRADFNPQPTSTPSATVQMNALQRSLMTISCPDADHIPKVPQAGCMLQRGADRVQLMHNGVEVVYGGYHGDWMAHVIRGLRGHHEPQEELLFYHLIRYMRHRTIMVELGSFWAYYTQWFLKDIPDSRAWCVEPDEHNMSVGQRNAALNGTTERVRFFRAWLGGQALESHSAPSETSPTPITLPMLDAAQVLAMVGEPIELLHMDMQGAETGFLSSLDPATARAQLRFVMVSTHHSSISGSATCHVDCVEALRARGAAILIEHDVIESYSGDGLIVASFQPDDVSLHFPKISRNRAETSLFKTA